MTKQNVLQIIYRHQAFVRITDDIGNMFEKCRPCSILIPGFSYSVQHMHGAIYEVENNYVTAARCNVGINIHWPAPMSRTWNINRFTISVPKTVASLNKMYPTGLTALRTSFKKKFPTKELEDMTVEELSQCFPTHSSVVDFVTEHANEAYGEVDRRGCYTETILPFDATLIGLYEGSGHEDLTALSADLQVPIVKWTDIREMARRRRHRSGRTWRARASASRR